MKPDPYKIGQVATVLCLIAFLSPAQDKAEKGIIKIDLAYYQLDTNLPIIKISAKTKKNKKFESVEGVEINLFFNTESAQGFMGRVNTNSRGAGSLSLPGRFKVQWDSLPAYTFIGTLTQNDRFEDQSTKLEISKARIELTLEDVDSIRKIHAKVLAFKDTGWVAQPETELKLVVRRLNSDLKATDEDSFTTDENGVVSAEFSLIVPGDAQGNVIIGAKIDEHETYGNLVATKTAKWGVPLVLDDRFAKRTLWSTRDKTPYWLLIFPNLIIVGVWGIIFYLVYQIVRISRLGKVKDPS